MVKREKGSCKYYSLPTAAKTWHIQFLLDKNNHPALKDIPGASAEDAEFLIIGL